jgi:3-phosphoshikimate 1-carboxyvinyltransferase
VTSDVRSSLATMKVASCGELPSLLRIPTWRELGTDRASRVVDVRPPGSKSLTNRAVLLAALASGESTLVSPLLDADDAAQMLRAVEKLGAHVSILGDRLTIRGVGGSWKPAAADREVSLHLNNAGTAVRFLAGAAILSPVPVIIDGNERMRRRPIGELVAMLRAIGCGAECLGEAPDCPPVRISPLPSTAAAAATVTVGATLSSQFVSALALAAPFLPRGLTILYAEPPTSESYVQMTLGLLSRLGVTTRTSSDGRVLRVSGLEEHGCLAGFRYEVEPDASGATYFWAAGALAEPSGLRCRVRGLDEHSLQGDAAFPELLRRMGAEVTTGSDASSAFIETSGATRLEPVLADMSDMPDAAMSLASVACFASGTSVIRGLKTLRVKETDRIAAMQTELGKIGVRVATDVSGDPDAITITPPPGGVDCSDAAARVEFDTYDDHRMAMSLSLIGLRRPNTFVRHPACVAKTYPGYWREFERLVSP